MNNKILDGKKAASEYLDNLKLKIIDYENKYNKKIQLTVVQVGNKSSSNSYIARNIKSCNYVGIDTELKNFPDDISTEELINEIQLLNNNANINGIILQLPLPKQIDVIRVSDSINPLKDVDGMTQINAGALFLGRKNAFMPDTPMGAITLLKVNNIEIAGKHIVIIGRSNIVGKPLALLLLQENATVTICHSKTINLSQITQSADILISAVGKPKFVTEDMVGQNAIVLDIGTNFVDGKLVGDVDFENVINKVSKISPVPGGCGPMTVCMLIENTLKAAIMQHNDNIG